ncbi:hypothetical protein [Streptomyces phaeoluteigriseus]
MRTVLVAATGLPTILLSAALVVIVCFWLLAAVGVAEVDSFDTDADLRAWRMSGVPVTVAFSLLTVLAWLLSVGAAVVLAVLAPSGPVTGVLRMVVPVGALPVAWGVSCLIVKPLHRLLTEEPALCVLGPGESALSVLSEVRPGDDAVRVDPSRDVSLAPRSGGGTARLEP